MICPNATTESKMEHLFQDEVEMMIYGHGELTNELNQKESDMSVETHWAHGVDEI